MPQDVEKTDKSSKTGLIMKYIGKHGPKTEYNLYKELPGLSHGTIHFCLKKLTDEGALTSITSKKIERRSKKLYNLTFMGTVIYLASLLYWLEKDELSESEIARFWKDFEEKKQSNLIEFLEKQGALLKYAPFKEIRWLSEHYPGIIAGLLVIANTICRHPPSPYKKPFVTALFSTVIVKSSPKEIVDEGKELLGRLNVAFRDEFTDLFFQLVTFVNARGKIANIRLLRLAKERLKEREYETSELRRAIKLFGRQNLAAEKR